MNIINYTKNYSRYITLYHATSKKNWDKIKNEGLKPNVGELVNHHNIEEAHNTPGIYLTPNLGYAHCIKHFKEKLGGDKGVILKIKIPRKEFYKLNRQADPELGKARNYDEWRNTYINKIKNKYKNDPEKLNMILNNDKAEKRRMTAYDDLHKTRVVTDNIDKKYIRKTIFNLI